MLSKEVFIDRSNEMASLKILEEIMNKLDHQHHYEFIDFNGAESVFCCTVPGCSSICIEPEDAGTGA